jgi:hypothetical protein
MLFDADVSEKCAVSIRGKENMTGIRTNREPTVTFQVGVCVGSRLREGYGPFQGSPQCVVFLF